MLEGKVAPRKQGEGINSTRDKTEETSEITHSAAPRGMRGLFRTTSTSAGRNRLQFVQNIGNKRIHMHLGRSIVMTD